MPNKIETTLAAVNGGQDVAILTAKGSVYPFENGKRTSDTPIGTKFTVALQGNRLTTLTVKIEGTSDPLPNVLDEKIEAACNGLKFFLVRFQDCKVALYSIGGQMAMTATSSGIELVNAGK